MRLHTSSKQLPSTHWVHFETGFGVKLVVDRACSEINSLRPPQVLLCRLGNRFPAIDTSANQIPSTHWLFFETDFVVFLRARVFLRLLVWCQFVHMLKMLKPVRNFEKTSWAQAS